MKQRMAEEKKKKREEDYRNRIESAHAKGPSSAELNIRRRQAEADAEKQRKLQQAKVMGPILSQAYGAGDG